MSSIIFINNRGIQLIKSGVHYFVGDKFYIKPIDLKIEFTGVSCLICLHYQKGGCGR